MRQRVRTSVWLACGAMVFAVQPGTGSARADEPYGRHQIDEDLRTHWSFQRVQRPKVPTVSHPEWVLNPIDAFVLKGLERAGLEPAPPAQPAKVLRRIYLDLIGLPPTPAEQAAFLADPSPEAYRRIVDQLLARPEYGERWARHWLDVVRYAETNGYERDGAKPHAWRYRDYVIGSLNADKPYDRFLIEQLAGDELEDTSAEAQIATTFLRLGPWDDEPADPLADRYDQLDDLVGTTATAFMALTLRCARCHDHKFEPLSQRDYSRALAIFEPLKRPSKGLEDLGSPVGTPAELAAYDQASRQAKARIGMAEAELAELESSVCRSAVAAGRLPGGQQVSSLPPPVVDPAQLPPTEALAATSIAPAERNDQQKKLVQQHREKLRQAVRAAATADEKSQLQERDRKLGDAVAAQPKPLPMAYVFVEDSTKAPATKVFKRGDPRQPAEEVDPGFPAVLVGQPPPAPTPTAKSTGRRLQLARWLASPDHPLTARVIVNRLWQHHFGDGLVASENDFGVVGAEPSHPKLLDWLSSELAASGWSLKHVHRLMVLSNTYQMSSRGSEAGQKLDPDGKLLWRFRPRRLEAEAIRDLMLAVSGQLNLEQGGPSFYPVISRAVLETQSRPGNGWGRSPASQTTRRSIYAFVKRTLLVPELELLDLPSTENPCEQRMVSTTAPQALTLLNGEMAGEQATALAKRLMREAADDAARIDLAFRLALCRPPTADELAATKQFLASHRAQIEADARLAGRPAGDAAQRALAGFCLVLLNTNELAYVE